ncbi:hypothetical protein GBA52_005370 [Prunus armeniaca]|nr:hypothetical protein GBA52_005370 [Prunus armeniaca]
MARDGEVVPVDPQAVVAVKKKSSRSWVLLDCTGKATVLDVDKYAIMHRVHIHARDLRIVDPLLSYPSTILGRDRAIVLNLEHIKAIITAEEVLLRDPVDENVIPVVEELQRRLPPVNAIHESQKDGKEFPAGQIDVDAGEEDVPGLGGSFGSNLQLSFCTSFTELETAAYPALDELTSKISSRNLDRVQKLKSAMTRLTAQVILYYLLQVRDELEQLLDDDDDMADLYLSRKLAGASSPVSVSGPPNWYPASPTIGSKISRASRASIATVRGDENDVEELEMLLEAYFMQIDGTLNKLATLREYIDDTEDYINIQTCFLFSSRFMVQLELFLSAGTLCMAIFSLVAGIFGMNIPYTWNDGYGYMFKWVCIVTGIVCACVFIIIMSYARFKGLVGSQVVKRERAKLEACMTCPLCNKLFSEATTISECLHTFCRKCIYKKIIDEEVDYCPKCKADLGVSPLEKLRADNNWEDIRAKLFPSDRKKVNAAADHNVQDIKEKTVPSETKEFKAPADHNMQDITPKLFPSEREQVKAPSVSSVTFPAKRKERYLSSLVISTPRVSSSSDMSGRRRYPTRRSFTLQESLSIQEPEKKEEDLLERLNSSGTPKKDAVYTRQNSIEGSSKQHMVNKGVEDNAQPGDGKANLWKPLNRLVEGASNTSADKLPVQLLLPNQCCLITSTKKHGRPCALATDTLMLLESQVEISLQGKPVIPTLQLQNLVDLWLRTTPASQIIQTSPGSSAKEYVMALTYGRKMQLW